MTASHDPEAELDYLSIAASLRQITAFGEALIPVLDMLPPDAEAEFGEALYAAAMTLKTLCQLRALHLTAADANTAH